MSVSPIAETVASLMPRARAELAELVAFRSVADPAQFPREECEAAAAWVADALRAEGFQDVAALDTPDGTQSVYFCHRIAESRPIRMVMALADLETLYK
ncbi:dipeptidase, partial [Streptomyces niveus]